MIEFKEKKLEKDLKFNNFNIPEGSTILKIFFNEKDIRKTNDGALHLDVFGTKALDLLDNLLGVMLANRKLEKNRRKKSVDIKIHNPEPIYTAKQLKDKLAKEGSLDGKKS